MNGATIAKGCTDYGERPEEMPRRQLRTREEVIAWRILSAAARACPRAFSGLTEGEGKALEGSVAEAVRTYLIVTAPHPNARKQPAQERIAPGR